MMMALPASEASSPCGASAASSTWFQGWPPFHDTDAPGSTPGPKENAYWAGTICGRAMASGRSLPKPSTTSKPSAGAFQAGDGAALQFAAGGGGASGSDAMAM